jgi:protein-tyrosine phosphatase
MATVTEIVPNLFLGGESLIPIAPAGFEVIVSLREVPDFELPDPKRILQQGGPVMLSIPLVDAAIPVPLWKISVACEVLDWGVMQGKRCLAHCEMGHNRSGLIVAAYLVTIEAMSPVDAIALIQSKRPGALTNQTFVKQILDLGSKKAT